MDIDALKESLLQYESQLLQIDKTLEITPKGDEYNSLISLKTDIQELIELTNENITKLHGKNNVNDDKKILENKEKNNFDDEYALFMAEMSKSGAYDDIQQNNTSKIETGVESDDVNIEEELTSLEGVKCSVLYSHKWGGDPSLCNAMICSTVQDTPDNTNFHAIKVRVMFTNPTHIDMVPCPFYLNGNCKFNDELCRFSHGEVYNLSSLQEAIEPDFSGVKNGTRVLAKINKNEETSSNKISEKYLIWHRAIITDVIDDYKCKVKLENDILYSEKTNNNYEVDFQYIFPLIDNKCSDFESDSESSLEYSLLPDETERSEIINNVLVEKSLINESNRMKLGEWEKHTRGIGSKLMQKMGYIVGTGLGPQGTGIMNPIPCQVLPAGRSLDHCMDLREKDLHIDPIKAEKKLRRLQKREKEREKKAYERVKEKEKHNVFNFLNNTLANQSDKQSLEQKQQNDKTSVIKDISCKNLNIERFKLSENLKKMEKDVSKLKERISKNSGNTDVQRSLTLQLNAKLKDMKDIQLREFKITAEQNNRKDKKKYSVF